MCLEMVGVDSGHLWFKVVTMGGKAIENNIVRNHSLVHTNTCKIIPQLGYCQLICILFSFYG